MQLKEITRKPRKVTIIQTRSGFTLRLFNWIEALQDWRVDESYQQQEQITCPKEAKSKAMLLISKTS